MICMSITFSVCATNQSLSWEGLHLYLVLVSICCNCYLWEFTDLASQSAVSNGRKGIHRTPLEVKDTWSQSWGKTHFYHPMHLLELSFLLFLHAWPSVVSPCNKPQGDIRFCETAVLVSMNQYDPKKVCYCFAKARSEPERNEELNILRWGPFIS